MLKQRLQDDMKVAMKAVDKRRLGVIRLLLAAIKQQEVDERIELDDTQGLAVLDKQVKQRRDSIAQFTKAGREDLAEQEGYEVGVCREYLSAALAEDEVAALIDAAIAAAGGHVRAGHGQGHGVDQAQDPEPGGHGRRQSAGQGTPRGLTPCSVHLFCSLQPMAGRLPSAFIDALLARIDSFYPIRCFPNRFSLPTMAFCTQAIA